MATFLDFSLVRNFAGIFTWLLVWVITYGLLEVTGFFGKERQGINAMIAFALAFLALFTPPVRFMVEFAVPWLTALAIGVFFIIFVFMAFGVPADMIKGWAETSVRPWIIAISVLIIIFAMGGAFGQPLLEEGQGARGTPIPGEGIGFTGEFVEGENTGDYPVDGGMQPTQQGVPVGIGSGPARRNAFADNLILTFTHPKVLALVFIMLLATFTIVFLARDT